MTFAESSTLQLGQMIEAFNCDRVEIGLLRFLEDGSKRMIMYQHQSGNIVNLANRLRKANVEGRCINIRPLDKRFTFLDDLTAEALDCMVATGFRPAIVVQTSPDNYQAWMKHHTPILDHELARAIAKALAGQFGADAGAAAHAHFGKLAGFLNKKPARCIDGKYPLVTLEGASGVVYDQSQAFLEGVDAGVVEARRQREAFAESARNAGPKGLSKTIDQFREKIGDFHRADLAFTVHALGCGLPHAEIAAAIATRDLSKKDPRYVQRTIAKAAQYLGQTLAS